MECKHERAKIILNELLKVMEKEKLTYREASLIAIDLQEEISRQKSKKINTLLSDCGPEEIQDN